MPTLTTTDGTSIYYRDWGTGDPIVFSHGWPLTGAAWEAQMLFFNAQGYRTIAHDRRGNGYSDQPGFGNDVDTLCIVCLAREIGGKVRVNGRVSDISRALRYRPDLFGRPFSELLQEVMKGPSPWTEAERELFAAFVSARNLCPF